MNRATPRRGVSLLEVLISIFVISVGLMSLAMLIPAGAMAINEANKSDRSGACGRAAMREVKIRRMLDRDNWAGDPGDGPFAIDPLGIAKVPGEFAGGLPRIGLSSVPSLDVADSIFTWRDDLTVVFPEDRSLRSSIFGLENNGDAVSDGHYSWFMTVTPSPAEPPNQKRTFSVSVVVCHDRFSESPNGVAYPVDFSASGGGTIPTGDELKIRTNQWLMLVDDTQCKWYRVACAGVLGVGRTMKQAVSLVGPYWDDTSSSSPQVVIIEDVIGVYSTTVATDQNWNLIWKKVE